MPLKKISKNALLRTCKWICSLTNVHTSYKLIYNIRFAVPTYIVHT